MFSVSILVGPHIKSVQMKGNLNYGFYYFFKRENQAPEGSSDDEKASNKGMYIGKTFIFV